LVLRSGYSNPIEAERWVALRPFPLFLTHTAIQDVPHMATQHAHTPESVAQRQKPLLQRRPGLHPSSITTPCFRLTRGAHCWCACSGLWTKPLKHMSGSYRLRQESARYKAQGCSNMPTPSLDLSYRLPPLWNIALCTEHFCSLSSFTSSNYYLERQYCSPLARSVPLHSISVSV